MTKRVKEITDEAAEYYSEKLALHSTTAKGVDWNSEDSQLLRFAKLCTMIPSTDPYSIIDYGCGYGALFEYLSRISAPFQYHGYDVCEPMIAAAKRLHESNANATFSSAAPSPLSSDYAIASGIFNVRQQRTVQEWTPYVLSILDELHRITKKGFSFNCLTSYSDLDKMRADLYYADPCVLFDHCKRLYSKNVALLHDYNLYEFTIVVKKAG